MSSTPTAPKHAVVHHMDPLREIAKRGLAQMKDDDRVITYIRRAMVFSVYNNSEFLPQIAEWRRLRCVMRRSNTRELTIDGKKVYMFIIQPPEGQDCDFCPLALAHGLMVSGYAYLTPYRSTVELVERVIGI